MKVDITQKPDGVSLEQNLKQALERLIASQLGDGASVGDTLNALNFVHNGVTYKVSATVTGIFVGSTYRVRLNSIQ